MLRAIINLKGKTFMNRSASTKVSDFEAKCVGSCRTTNLVNRKSHAPLGFLTALAIAAGRCV